MSKPFPLYNQYANFSSLADMDANFVPQIFVQSVSKLKPISSLADLDANFVLQIKLRSCT
jgi:hypothetical protein